MISSRGKINFGQPSVSSLASRELARMLVFDNTNLRSMWICRPIVSIPERSLVFILSRIRDRKLLFIMELQISVPIFTIFDLLSVGRMMRRIHSWLL